MENVTIVIPTRNRLAKLKRTLSTIPDLPYVETWVVSDGDPHTAAWVRDCDKPRTLSVHIKQHMGSVCARNAVIPDIQDGVLYAVDDIDFLPGCIENAFEAFNRAFPSSQDGVIGICQIGHSNWHPTGVALLGKEFIDRYPNRQPFFPGYWHFAAQEIHWLASKYGVFRACPDAQIRHYHPDFGRNGRVDRKLAEFDKTHQDARIKGVEDRNLRNARKRKGLIWGDTAT